jgi:ubiquinone/menaquinone biosynthesis C-methylase UbiE
MRDIIITDEILRQIAASEADFSYKYKKRVYKQADYKPLMTYRSGLHKLQYFTPGLKVEDLKKQKILEVGSGNGFFLCFAQRNGFNITGIEPGKTLGFEGRYKRAYQLLTINGVERPEQVLIEAQAESLPFPDKTFDIVFNIAVLEHVSDINRALDEMLRVLKPGGLLIADIPNYHSWYEAHFDMFWLPFLNKRWAKFYVQKIGKRDPSLIDELNFTTVTMFKRKLKRLTKKKGYKSDFYLAASGIINLFLEIHNITRNPERSLHYNQFFSTRKIFAKKIIEHFLKNKFMIKLCRFLIYIPVQIIYYLGFVITFVVLIQKNEEI